MHLWFRSSEASSITWGWWTCSGWGWTWSRVRLGSKQASISCSHEERKQEVEEVEVVEVVEATLRHTADNWALQISNFVRET